MGELLEIISIYCFCSLFFIIESKVEDYFREKNESLIANFTENKSLKVFKIGRSLLCILAGLEFSFQTDGYPNIYPFYLLFLFLGVLLRCLAIKSLGEYWSFNIRIYRCHRIIKTGIYKYIQHPAYWGNIYIVFFFAVFGLYVSAAVSMVFISIFGVWRAKTETKLLHQFC